MAFINQLKKNKGISMIEISVAIAIIGIALVALLGLISSSLKVTISAKQMIEANSLAQEGLEQARNFRDTTDWSTNGLGVVTLTIPHHFEQSGLPPAWQLIDGEELINGFQRKLIFEAVIRDDNDNIVESGGTPDSDTKKVTSIVSSPNREIEIVTYFTNWNQ